MVNINVRIPDDLHKKVKLSAIQRDSTIKDYIIDRLNDGIRRRIQ